MLTGCAVGPNYKRPVVASPTTWKEAAVATNAHVLPEKWWSIFNDTELDSLQAQTIEANQDLKRAVARVTEARAIARVAASELYPSIFAGGSYSRIRISEHHGGHPNQNLEGDDYNASLDLSYELDVWGRVRRSTEAALMPRRWQQIWVLFW
jgi:multidrug efflux system outer membrane protein